MKVWILWSDHPWNAEREFHSVHVSRESAIQHASHIAWRVSTGTTLVESYHGDTFSTLQEAGPDGRPLQVGGWRFEAQIQEVLDVRK